MPRENGKSSQEVLREKEEALRQQAEDLRQQAEDLRKEKEEFRKEREQEEQVKELMAETDAEHAKAKAEGKFDMRPVVVIQDNQYHYVLDETVRELKKLKPSLYRQGQRLVWVGRGELPADGVDAQGNKNTTTVPVICGATPVWLQIMFADVIRFERFRNKTKKVAVKPPRELAEMVLAAHNKWGDAFPLLAGIISTPTLRPDGTLLSEEGYDPATALYLTGAPTMPPIKDKPTKEDALAALHYLNDGMLTEFPFEDEDAEWGPNRSVALSAVMTPVLRAAFDHAPLHVVSAPTKRTGKSYLLNTVAMIVLGNRMPVITLAKNREGELDKTLSALLIRGASIIAIGNIGTGQALGGDLLCQALTENPIQPRILGKSEIKDAITTATTFFADGNNIEIEGDATERSIKTHMNAKRERPAERTFSGNPLQWARDHRGEAIAAILTIARAYIVAGRPGLLTMNGFEGWSHVVRSALVWLGCADPCSTTSTLVASDPHIQVRAMMYNAIANTVGIDVQFQAGELTVWPGDTPTKEQKAPQAALSAALAAVCKDKGVDAIRIGKWLGESKDIYADGMALVLAGNTGGSRRWKLLKTQEVPQSSKGNF